ncbi:MAG TPA: hypothetical protein VLG11_01370 [Candidatus Saccharimonadales bacterium]|nr:hypothetical protein [Candidatus Saccharimonadales bacterium]
MSSHEAPSFNNGDTENNGELPAGERAYCLYRDPSSMLNDDDAARAFFGEFPAEAEEDSPEAEAAMSQLICKRPSCLLNVRVALAYAMEPGMESVIQDVAHAVPPDCGWREAGIQPES